MGTTSFVRRQPGGKFAIVDNSVTTGNFFWVDSGKTTTGGDTVGHGRDPSEPFLSLNYAFASGQVVANQGDIIYLMPGHAEVVASAGALDMDIEGVTVIGIGHGAAQPTITLTLNTADIDVDAANITIENVNFVAGAEDVAVCLDVNADDFTCRRCRFTESATTLNFKICIQDAAAGGSDRITVEDCYVLQPDSANTHFISLAGTGDGHILRRNILHGDWGTFCLGSGGAVTNCVCVDNLINNVASDGDACINFEATATGICMRNLCGAGAAAASGITATAMAIAENYYTQATGDDSGLLEPIAT